MLSELAGTAQTPPSLRHVEKNGGSTFRSLLEQNSRHGRCVRGGNPRPWDVAEVSDALRRGQRVCAEAHGEVGYLFWSRDVPRLRALGVSAGGCSGVKVFLRVREPFAWYVSWFRWEAGYRGLVRLNESTAGAMEHPAETLLPIQARKLLIGALAVTWPRGLAGLPRMQLIVGPKRYLAEPPSGALSAEERRRLELALASADARPPGLSRATKPPSRMRLWRQADLVGPTERMAEFAVLAARLAGGWLSSTFATQNTFARLAELSEPGEGEGEGRYRCRGRKVKGEWVGVEYCRTPTASQARSGGEAAEMPARDDEGVDRLCGEDDPALPACRAMVRRIAADDHWLHDAAVARFEATLAAHEGGDFRREVAAQRDNAAALERRELEA
ncbi:hypothetical protein EMIHUDRAFT_238464 [Emiliania huxleyi CCMP1516]|uniref:Uncharacterized protein n=2 Tax=Emiliania huxleyi TaxID=2903 RepID=A0A0D3JLP4_EMIH1|nr:hypothetical protein EMIHUDRAFT_238464 [Emiliania huxleyi CCMP1516]EOD24429.1 hypothetical protein EMIHUDRAFT_238464 [Emiliania huxleyi CCMP1516]|eukprot:XP_005776858.1 hypothetical protein EMIHUDRAFT_238464 [Emiliania huxleyi CCMP1516]